MAVQIGLRLSEPKDLLAPDSSAHTDSEQAARDDAEIAGLTGYAAIAMLQHALHKATGDSNWTTRGHEFAKRAIAAQPKTMSLVSGWAGITLALSWLRDLTGGYQKIVSSLQDALEESVASALEDTFAIESSHEYELFTGYAGLYLALDRERHSHTIDRIVDYFEWLFDDSERWRIPNAYDQLGRGRQNVLGVSHGIAGVLGSLLFNASTEHKIALASRVAGIIKAGRAIEFTGAQWGYSLSESTATMGKTSLLMRPAWCHGTLGIAAVLCSASNTLNLPELNELAVEAANTVLDVPMDQWHMLDHGICHGVMGNALLFRHIGQSTGLKRASEAAIILSEMAIGAFDPTLPYGYLTIDRDRLYSDPSLVTGAPGIGLALLTIAELVDDRWLEIFGIATSERPDPAL